LKKKTANIFIQPPTVRTPLVPQKNLATVTRKNKILCTFEEDFWLLIKNLYERLPKSSYNSNFLKPLMVRTVKEVFSEKLYTSSEDKEACKYEYNKKDIIFKTMYNLYGT
jgi:hypothetical protein